VKVYLISQPTIDWAQYRKFADDEHLPDDLYWVNPASNAELLVELAGRLCYMSYGKGRKTNREFLDNIIESGHFSVLEHANFTFFITGVSRSLTHELVRHRHFSFSQLSQRYVDESEADMIYPSAFSPEDADIAARVFDQARGAYRALVQRMEEKFADEPNSTLRRKLARQAARAVLPNATETKIAVTGNVRTWREFIQKRAIPQADPEIRKLAAMIYDVLLERAPGLFRETL
jgi:thymidylate synthase (FAD)